jgi:nucleoside-diphosphate-sugar epimerase
MKYKKKILETSKLNPESPYAVSKLAAEKLISFYTKYYGLKSYILRPFNIYGPKQNHESEYSAVIPKFINQALNSDDLTIYGNGQQKRDFINVNDVVRACIKCLNNNEKNKYGIYNVGTGNAISIVDLAKIIIKLTGKGKIVYQPKKKSDANFSCADIRKIKKELNFTVKKNFKNNIYKLIKEWKKNIL